MKRAVFTFAVNASVLTGCLFPSFDELRGAGAVADAGADVSPNTTNARTNSDAGDVADASGEDASVGVVACGETQCDATTSYCCTGGDVASCIPANSMRLCQAVIRCDGPEDCPEGRVCCVPFASNESSCQSSCMTGRILCHPEAPQCPNGERCTGRQDIGAGMSGFFCE